MSETIHIWGREFIIKKNECSLIRILKLKSGAHINLFLDPETLYLQTGSLVCLENGLVIEEGAGDLFFGNQGAFNFIALSDSTIYETRYFTSRM